MRFTSQYKKAGSSGNEVAFWAATRTFSTATRTFSTEKNKTVFRSVKIFGVLWHLQVKTYNSEPTTPHKNIETNSRFTRKIDISSHMESLNFQSGNDETA